MQPANNPNINSVDYHIWGDIYQKIISNDSYAHDEQGDNPGQVRGLDGVLYKL